jgi:hypothetical protein
MALTPAPPPVLILRRVWARSNVADRLRDDLGATWLTHGNTGQSGASGFRRARPRAVRRAHLHRDRPVGLPAIVIVRQARQCRAADHFSACFGIGVAGDLVWKWLGQRSHDQRRDRGRRRTTDAHRTCPSSPGVPRRDRSRPRRRTGDRRALPGRRGLEADGSAPGSPRGCSAFALFTALPALLADSSCSRGPCSPRRWPEDARGVPPRSSCRRRGSLALIRLAAWPGRAWSTAALALGCRAQARLARRVRVLVGIRPGDACDASILLIITPYVEIRSHEIGLRLRRVVAAPACGICRPARGPRHPRSAAPGREQRERQRHATLPRRVLGRAGPHVRAATRRTVTHHHQKRRGRAATSPRQLRATARCRPAVPLGASTVRARASEEEVTKAQGGGAKRAVETGRRCGHHRTAWGRRPSRTSAAASARDRTRPARSAASTARRHGRCAHGAPDGAASTTAEDWRPHQYSAPRTSVSPVSRRRVSLAHALTSGRARCARKREASRSVGHAAVSPTAGGSPEDDRDREHRPGPVLAGEGWWGREGHDEFYEPASRLIAAFASFARASSGKRRAYSS